MTKLNIGRFLIVLGLVVGLESLRQTFSHIGDPLYTVTPQFGGGTTHSWYHALREVMGDLSTIGILLLVMFGWKSWRTPATWWISLILMFGYYSPFWIGIPFNAELAAPSFAIDLRHMAQAAIPVIGLFLARTAFFGEEQTEAGELNGAVSHG
ncbi:MAG: hypothetical protein QNI98_13235 [Woeseiaceae bacterium]|nr:hypothetical protein [Woeseiaceae bacterium]